MSNYYLVLIGYKQTLSMRVSVLLRVVRIFQEERPMQTQTHLTIKVSFSNIRILSIAPHKVIANPTVAIAIVVVLSDF